MNDYFVYEDSMKSCVGGNVKDVIGILANRFMANNPPQMVTYHIRSKEGFGISEDYMDEIRLHDKFPSMKLESFVYAWASLEAKESGNMGFRFQAYGPVYIYVNGEFVYRTNHVQERLFHQSSMVTLPLKKGVNSIFFQCVHTPLGCGFHIGSSSFKGRRIQFFGGTKAHQGMSGFSYSEPTKEPLKEIPKLYEENSTALNWYPKVNWEEKEVQLPVYTRLFGEKEGYLLQAAKFFLGGTKVCHLHGYSEENAELYLDGKYIKSISGHYSMEEEIAGGNHIVLIKGKGSSFNIEGAVLEAPVKIATNVENPFIYLGPFAKADVFNLEEVMTFQKPVKTKETKVFWNVDRPSCVLRPFNEGTNYGEWSYPLGVTLYGLIQTGRLLENKGIHEYIKGHMERVTKYFSYCLWDKEEYGAAPFLNQLTTVDSLDDCGSFASALLEYSKDSKVPEAERIADYVANYMKNEQQRLADQTFYRNHSYLPVMNETVWADDMYMCIPFLCRYYQYSKDEAYLEEAARQAIQIFDYLYMPEENILSHIYDTRHQVQTKVPWGRGNGWALFSFSELLAVLPKEHENYPKVLSRFQQISAGYLKLQGEDGMWHQVLTFPESYRETSSSAMFVYGFARGVRYGWYEKEEPYQEAALKGWDGLCSISCDKQGNVYGVCRGSGYSFSSRYYADELSWNLNDTHGIGIVMLAGIEVEKMFSRVKELA